MNINRVTISGNLTGDPERYETANGNLILNFSVAVNERRKEANGEWANYANYIDCVLFGNRVDYFSQALAKGTHVTIDGRLRWTQWEAKDGSGKRSKLEVVVSEIDAFGPKGSDSDQNYEDADIDF